jgi:hypothetical protein
VHEHTIDIKVSFPLPLELGYDSIRSEIWYPKFHYQIYYTMYSKAGTKIECTIIRGKPEQAPNTRETGSGVYIYIYIFIYLFVRDLA